MPYQDDTRAVLTLDAGGTKFAFSAMRGLEEAVEPVRLPSAGDDLDRSVANLFKGFQTVMDRLETAPVAISFAFPGPADYRGGIIGDLVNLDAYRGGVPIGPMLEERFGLPVFINNDGDLFVYGEAIAGFLPWLNGLVEEAGNPTRYQNLFGVTLGTGFGGGIVSGGRLHLGDNSAAAEVRCLRNGVEPATDAEEYVSIRGVQRLYATAAGIPPNEAPSPREIYQIAIGEREGPAEAARQAYVGMGRALGDAFANAITLLDAPIVIGGGIAGAHSLFLPTVVEEMNTAFQDPVVGPLVRTELRAFNLEDEEERAAFCQPVVREIPVPGSDLSVPYDPVKRTGVGLSRLGTSRAVAVGAYAFALSELDRR